jgi:hypothetical protein
LDSVTEVDLDAALDTLRRDPTLRYSDSGRALLRWLDSRMVTMGQWRETMAGIPPHCQAKVAEIARACARAWVALADEVESTAIAEPGW